MTVILAIINHIISDFKLYTSGCEILALICGVIAGGVVGMFTGCREKRINIKAGAFMAGWVFYGILLYAITIYSRRYLKHRELVLLPFGDILSGKPDEGYHMLENIILFVPFGVLARVSGIKRKVSIVLGLFVSIAIEVMQYILLCGTSETDDVIYNLLGVVIGCLIFEFTRLNSLGK